MDCAFVAGEGRIVGSNSRVCSDNFRSDCFERYLKAEMLGVYVRASRNCNQILYQTSKNVEILHDGFQKERRGSNGLSVALAFEIISVYNN